MVVPFLTLVRGIDIRYAIGASLVSVIATPVMRVAVSCVGFLCRRDWVYVGVSLLVLSLLMYSLVAGPL